MRSCYVLLPILLLAVCWRSVPPARATANASSQLAVHRTLDKIPHANVTDHPSYRSLSAMRADTNDPTNPFAAVHISAVTTATPHATVNFDISVRNFEAITRTATITAQLPAGLVYSGLCTPDHHCDTTSPIDYHPTTHQLTWQSNLPPAHLDYILQPAHTQLPYIDLADFGAPNLCTHFVKQGVGCDSATVTFNLGINGYAASLFGMRHPSLTVSTDGVVSTLTDPQQARYAASVNQWLPAQAPAGVTLAGLWRDNDLTEAGRWHVAILDGLVSGHPVFYAQWHNAPHADNANSTVRHAIAVLLDGTGGMNGHVFYIYDNISHPSATVASGYTIGIADATGGRGHTYAYSSPDATHGPQGYPPLAGTTYHVYPTLMQPANATGTTVTISAHVATTAPHTLVTTVEAHTDSADPPLAHVWFTHYLHVRWHAFLPTIK